MQAETHSETIELPQQDESVESSRPYVGGSGGVHEPNPEGPFVIVYWGTGLSGKRVGFWDRKSVV